MSKLIRIEAVLVCSGLLKSLQEDKYVEKKSLKEDLSCFSKSPNLHIYYTRYTAIKPSKWDRIHYPFLNTQCFSFDLHSDYIQMRRSQRSRTQNSKDTKLPLRETWPENPSETGFYFRSIGFRSGVCPPSPPSPPCLFALVWFIVARLLNPRVSLLNPNHNADWPEIVILIILPLHLSESNLLIYPYKFKDRGQWVPEAVG